jgi:hypothetical protein
MQVFNIKAFDDFIHGNTAVFTTAEINGLLGKADKLALMAVADQVTGTTNLTVQIEHSGDGRNWVAKNGSAEIPATSIPASATTVLAGSDSGSSPSLGFVRLRLTLSQSIAVGHVKVYVTGRDEG